MTFADFIYLLRLERHKPTKMTKILAKKLKNLDLYENWYTSQLKYANFNGASCNFVSRIVFELQALKGMKDENMGNELCVIHLCIFLNQIFRIFSLLYWNPWNYSIKIMHVLYESRSYWLIINAIIHMFYIFFNNRSNQYIFLCHILFYIYTKAIFTYYVMWIKY